MDSEHPKPQSSEPLAAVAPPVAPTADQRKSSRLSRLLFVLAALLVVWHFAPVWFGYATSPLVGKPAPDASVLVEGSDLRHPDRIKLSSLRGSVLVLDFWASWCPPCRHTMPILDQFARDYAGRGVKVLSINTDTGLPFRSVVGIHDRLGGKGTLAVQDDTHQAQFVFKVRLLPTVIVIDRRGVIRWVSRGVPDRSDLEEGLSGVL